MTHFESVVGDVGPASSKERRDAFLTAGPEMVEFLERCGVRFVRCHGYSDYYSNLPGGKRHRSGDRAGAVERPRCSATGCTGCSPASPRASASR